MLLRYTIAALGGFIATLGLIALANSVAFRRQLEAWTRGRMLHVAGFLRLAMGTIFILGAGQCSWPPAIIWFGILMLASGIIALLLGEQRLGEMTRWFAGFSEVVFRVWGAIAVAIGAFVIWAAI